MANFCASCGTATGGGRFCPKCGAPQDGTPKPAAVNTPSTPFAPAPPARSGAPVLKIVLISLVVLAMLGVAGTVGIVYYIKERVHVKLAQMKDRTGIDFHHASETQAGCELLDKDEAGRILGLTIVRVEGNQAGDPQEFCNYFTDEKSMAEARQDAEEERQGAGSGKEGQPNLKQIEDAMKGITGAVSGGDAPLLTVTVFRGNGKVALAGIKAANLLMRARGGSEPGPWDEAVFAPLDALMAVRKGNDGVIVDLRQIPHGHEKGLALAKAMTSGL